VRPHIAVRAIMSVISAVLLVLPFVFALASGEPFAEAMDWAWLLITAVVLAILMPIVWFAFRPPRSERREFRGAPVAMGTLVSARPTGMSINDQPELELVLDVETADGRTIRGTTREVIDLGMLPQVVPGAPLPVAYLDDGRIALARDASEEALQQNLYDARVRQGRLTAHQVRVAREGIAARAVVMAMRPTGEVRGTEAVVHLDLRVTRPNGSTFDATRELPVAQIALPGLQPASVVEVRYLPEDESYVAVSTRVM
jgi:hypothetical protein